MKLVRREFLRFAGGAAVFPALPRLASAQAYPSRPVRIIVSTAAGGGPDIVARLLGQWLSERLGQQFLIDNRPGASGNIGTDAVVKAPPDGYTLLMVGASSAINATLHQKLNFNFIRDVAPVAGIGRTAAILAVHPSVPVETVPDLITYAKTNPGRLNFGSPGIGSAPHMAGELLKMMAGIDLLHVPYRGDAPALTDLIGGQVPLCFVGAPAATEYIRTGKVRSLAVTSATRLQTVPDIPTLGEFLPGYEASGWFGFGAPRDTPAQIVAKLNQEIGAALADPKIIARLADLGSTPAAGSPADFGRLITEETEKWAKVIKFAGIKAE
jgi:tripartite-type tricarboxylate transporter receptor subunit TctC